MSFQREYTSGITERKPESEHDTVAVRVSLNTLWQPLGAVNSGAVVAQVGGRRRRAMEPARTWTLGALGQPAEVKLSQPGRLQRSGDNGAKLALDALALYSLFSFCFHCVHWYHCFQLFTLVSI